MRNKLLVYLHGFGFDKNNNKEFVEQLANKYNAEILSLNGPYDSQRKRGGFAWYEIQKEPKKHIFDERLDLSINFIISEVSKKLEELELEWNDVIMSGRSQGAFVSMYIALSGKARPNKVISLCGFYPDEILNRGIKNKNADIIWVEAAGDTVLTPEKKDTYKNLISKGCNITYVIDDKSDHDNLDTTIIDKL